MKLLFCLKRMASVHLIRKNTKYTKLAEGLQCAKSRRLIIRSDIFRWLLWAAIMLKAQFSLILIA